MTSTVRLVFGVHSHQPMGNLDEVFERALESAYDPFLAALERHPGVRSVIHYSGCLLEWLDAHAPRHLDRLATLAAGGGVELLGGGFYEPILPLIPPADRVGQIRMQTRYLRERLGARARGMWLAERVWEPTLPPVLREAGMEYTLLDDEHFLGALEGDPVGGHYVTEEQGDVTGLFPISERLRYLIPFREPSETIAFLRELASAGDGLRSDPVAVVVDDGEKFGLWPGTRRWVHGTSGRDGWLERFLGALEENASWLRTCTLAEVADEVPHHGRVYLPPGSYHEMGEWSLPSGRGRAYAHAVERARARQEWAGLRPFLKGGYFRNFLAKYPESHLSVRRAQILSSRLDADAERAASDRSGAPSPARRELWRAQCNCAYWHGIFGGLYLPFLRRAVGEHLCRAGRLLDEAGGGPPAARATPVDASGDGRAMIQIDTPHLGLLLDPARGGALRVVDVKSHDWPLGLTLTRRVEAYHEEVLRPGGAAPADDDHASIHQRAVRADEGMRAMVVSDDRTRACAVDRFLRPGTSAEDLLRGIPAESGDCFDGGYEARIVTGERGGVAGALLRRRGVAAGVAVDLVKEILAGPSPHLTLRYGIDPGAAPAPEAWFAVELNLALVESRGRLRILEGAGEGRVLDLREAAEEDAVTRLAVEEDIGGFALAVAVEPQASVWHYPVRTVSRSEGGFEANYQGSAVLLVWKGPPPRRARVTFEVVPRPVT